MGLRTRVPDRNTRFPDTTGEWLSGFAIFFALEEVSLV